MPATINEQSVRWGDKPIDDTWAGDGLLLVVGHPRSGTTFTGKLMGAHPDVAYLEEPGLGAYGVSAAADLEAKFAQAVHDTNIDPSTTTQPFNGLRPREVVDDEAMAARRETANARARTLVSDVVAFTRQQTGARVVVDKTPGELGILDSIIQLLPDVRTIHIVRDPRAVYASAADWAEKRGRPWWLTMGSDDLAQAIGEQWTTMVNSGLAAENKTTDAVIRVRYEDLMRDPEGCARVLMDFADLTFGEPTTRFLHEAWGTGTISSRADAWRTSVTPSEVSRVEAEAGACMEALGYERMQTATPIPVERTFTEAASTDAPKANGTQDAFVPRRGGIHDEVTVFRTGGSESRGHIHVWKQFANSAVQSRHLIGDLFKRDFVSTFRKSHLGVAWLFLAPLVAMVQWIFLRQRGVLETGNLPVPYPAYVLMGTTMWGLFMGFYRSGASTMQGSETLLQQVRFPHETLVFKQLGQTAATFVATLAVAFGVLVVTGVRPPLAAVLLPVVVIPLVLLATGVGLVVAMVSVVSVDIDKMLTALFGLLMFITPIVYAEGRGKAGLSPVARWNPLTYLVLSARDIVLEGKLYHPMGFAISAVLSIVIFGMALRLFYVSEPQLIERLL